MKRMIARKNEVDQLNRLYNSQRSEFVIVYGRRRIGKTYLVNQVFSEKFTFSFTGARDEPSSVQLQRYARQLQKFSGSPYAPNLKNWDDAFFQLQALIESRPKNERKVIFFDEMPWIDTPRSKFISSLEYFWNAWAAQRDDILFIACGSATSWMVNNIIRNRGGLYNRVTAHIYLRPFCLAECEELLIDLGCDWDRYAILQCYMALGGVPFYLSLIDPHQSVAQNIDRLFFHKNASLGQEFNELFNALFVNADKYIDIVRAIATRREGLLREDIIKQTKISGGGLSKMLDNLERCDSIEIYANYKNKSRNTIYRICDPYTLFYFKFIENNKTKDTNYWSAHLNTNQINAWQGFSFEMACITHLQQIKKALGIDGIATSSCAWHKTGTGSDSGAQIDLLIDRADRVINICEMKFCQEPYTITKEYETKLRNKMAIFKQASKTTKALVLTMVTTYGIALGKHRWIAQSEVTMDDLFQYP